MIYIKNLGVLTDHDITKVQPFEFGLTFNNFPFEHLNDEMKGNVIDMLNQSGSKLDYLFLDFTLNFERKDITANLYVNCFNRNSESFSDCYTVPLKLKPSEIKAIKKQLFIPFMMSI